MAATREYLDAYKGYLEKKNDYLVYCSKFFTLQLLLSNDGTASAEDTDVYIEAQGKFWILRKAQLSLPPKEPTLPSQKSRKGPFADYNFNNFDKISASIVPVAKQIRPPNISDPTITQTTGGPKIHFNIQRIKQGTPLVLNDLFVFFPSVTDAKSFSFRYTINSHSLPSNIAGELHVKLKVAEP